MKKIIVDILLLFLAFITGAIVCYSCKETKKVVITEYETKYNTITKDVNTMPDADKNKDLLCFYLSVPLIDIKYIQDDDYELSASLCERQWNKKVKIQTPSADYRNMVIGGAFIDIQLHMGLNIQYYRMFGRWGIGGGVSISQGFGQVSGGLVCMW